MAKIFTSDVFWFVGGLSVGLGVGLVSRRNGYKIFTNYSEWDMGPLGKN